MPSSQAGDRHVVDVNHLQEEGKKGAPLNTLNSATSNSNTFSNTLRGGGASNLGTFANTSNGSALPNSNIFNSNTFAIIQSILLYVPNLHEV
jgi:hypothetical protein